MIQVILKNSAGTITHVMHSVEELACALNDPLIKAQNNLSDLFSYVMSNHYRTTINGINYYHSNASFGVNQPPTIVFTELDKPHTNGDMKIVLKDQEDNVIEEKEITLKELANLLNDPNILECVNAAILEFYLFAQHMRTTIKGEEYRHKGYSVGFNQLPTYEFVKV